MSSNAEFIAAHRARKAGRVDVSATVVAHVCGLAEDRLRRFKPIEWRWQHDWRELGGLTYFNLAAVPLLVGELATHGEPAAAAKLMAWLGEQNAPVHRGNPAAAGRALAEALTGENACESRIDLKPIPAGSGGDQRRGETVKGGAAEQTSAAPARVSWAKHWEEQRE